MLRKVISVDIIYKINGAWLSLARALALGARGRQFKSVRPEVIMGLEVSAEGGPAYGWQILSPRLKRVRIAIAKARTEGNMLRNIVILFFILLFSGSAFAGELISKEAVNYYNEGVKLQKASNFAMADSLYQKTLLVDPYNSKWQKFILNNRGVMKAQQGSIEEAEILFNRSLQIDPEYLPSKLNLGFIYEQRRSELESIKYWLSVLNINLDDIKPKGFVLGEVQEPAVGK